MLYMIGFHSHGYIWSKTMLSGSLVTCIFNIDWCTRSTISLACGFFVVVKTGLTSNSFRKVVKYHLKSDPLSSTTWHGCRYLHIHVLLKNLLTLTYYVSMYSSLPVVTTSMSYVVISTISNHPMVGSIITLQVIPTLFLMIAPPV